MNTDRPAGDDHTLTDAERETLAAGWPDFWKVHAAVQSIKADAYAAGNAAAVAAVRADLHALAYRWEQAGMVGGAGLRHPYAHELRERLAALDVAPPTTDHDTVPS